MLHFNTYVCRIDKSHLLMCVCESMFVCLVLRFVICIFMSENIETGTSGIMFTEKLIC